MHADEGIPEQYKEEWYDAWEMGRRRRKRCSGTWCPGLDGTRRIPRLNLGDLTVFFYQPKLFGRKVVEPKDVAVQ